MPLLRGSSPRTPFFVPVRALHAEDLGGLGIRLRVRRAAIERGDEAVAVDVRVGIREGRAVAVGIHGAEVLAGVADEGLLVAVGIDDGHDVDNVIAENLGDAFRLAVLGQPPGEVHGAGRGFALTAVNVGHHGDAGLVRLVNGRIGQLHAPERPLLPAVADGIEGRDFGIRLIDFAELTFQLSIGIAHAPVDGDLCFGGRDGKERQCCEENGQQFFHGEHLQI